MDRLDLVFDDPERGEQRVALVGDRSWRIGSSPDNDIVIVRSDISRHHAILRIRQGSPHITDLNSKNGTFVNGRRTASSTVRVGDVIHLSSTRLVIEDHGSVDDASDPGSETGPRPGLDGLGEETQSFSGRASAQEMVSLLVVTAAAVRRGAVGEPLGWAVERLGLDAVVVLYRDGDGDVSMVSSAGDLGPLVRSSEALSQIARDHAGKRTGTRITEVTDLGESLLVTPMQGGHVLVARCAGAPPAVADMRALIAAVEAVLCSGNPPMPAGAAPGDRRDPELRRFGSPLHRIAGLSEVINECKRRAAEFASSASPVLLAGETGTGKSLFARVIHDLSRRSGTPFVVVGPSDDDGAESRSDGVESARRGTVYVSDLAALPVGQQERWLEQVASASSGTAHANERPRLIVSVSGSIDEEVKAGRLRAEAADAFGGVRLELPPLREHVEDIPLLVTHFQREVGGRRGSAGSGFTVAALEALASYHWPGNVGELRAEVLRLMTRAASDFVVGVSELSAHIREGLIALEVPPPDLGVLATQPLADGRTEFERWRILRALIDTDWNQSLAAQMLGLSRAGLFKKMRKLGLAGRDR
jgi:hypothetical protein